MSYNEVGNIFKISNKDLILLKSGKKKKLDIDLYSETDEQRCWKSISNFNKYKASKKILEQVSKQEKISIEKTGKVLGISKNTLKRLMEEDQLTVRVHNRQLKSRVDKLALDLKYLPQNGERYYRANELNFLGIFYQIHTDDIFYYLANGKTEYDTYKDAFENNPNGVWIGKKSRLSNEYEEANHSILDYYINKIAENLRYKYSCSYDDKEDFKAIAFEYILKNGGFYEKNLCHNPQKLNFVLVKNVQYIMKQYFCTKPKELGLTLTYEGIEYENDSYLADNTYNPELCYLEEKYSYLDKIEPLHYVLAKEISDNDFFAIDYPKKCFSRIARKYNLTDELFNVALEEIMTFIIKNRLVKITKDGKVIPRFYVDD